MADNVVKDFVAPNALGWRTIRVRRGDGIYLDAEAAEGGEAGATVDVLGRLEELLC